MAFSAVIDLFYGWNGQEKKAMSLWNDYIAPAIEDLCEVQRVDAVGITTLFLDPPLDPQYGIGDYADFWAWREFRERLRQTNTDLTSDAALEMVLALAEELRERGEVAR